MCQASESSSLLLIVRPRTQKVLALKEIQVLRLAPGGVGTAPMEDVEVEEVEEEDLDVHFKRKRQGGSRRKRVVKKPRRYTPTVIAEGESAAVFPPPAPLVIKLSAPR